MLLSSLPLLSSLHPSYFVSLLLLLANVVLLVGEIQAFVFAIYLQSILFSFFFFFFKQTNKQVFVHNSAPSYLQLKLVEREFSLCLFSHFILRFVGLFVRRQTDSIARTQAPTISELNLEEESLELRPECDSDSTHSLDRTNLLNDSTD